MQHGSHVSLDAQATQQPDCTFCQRASIDTYILKETANFRIVADHAPLVEGHLLIMPINHYPCYGAMPAQLDAELFALKSEVRRFFAQFYEPPIFWEHGIFRQTVFHAHLHCFPFGEARYTVSEGLHAMVVHTQDDIRTWYATRGHYFHLEDIQHALLFPPDIDTYWRIIRDALWSGVSARNGHTTPRSPLQRQEAGKPLIQMTAGKWRTFQQEEVNNADQASYQ